MWKGVIIEESLGKKDVLNSVRITRTKETSLEKEDEKGILHFHQIELDDDKKDAFVHEVSKSITQGWYIHIVKEGIMTVIFKGKTFTFSKYQKDKLDAARNYGVSIGILKEQMDFEILVDDPYA